MTEALAVNSRPWWDMRADRFLQIGDMRDSPHEYAEAAKHVLSPVLEVGCTFGSFSAHLPPNMQYVGIDVSEKAIRVARNRYPHRLFFARDIQALPFDWLGVFNSTAVFQTLEHFREPEKIVRILSRIGTRSVINVPLGKQSAHRIEREGHWAEWVDANAFAEMIKPFGKVHFLPATIGHLMGVVTWDKGEQ